jgi:hypothetical protein
MLPPSVHPGSAANDDTLSDDVAQENSDVALRIKDDPAVPCSDMPSRPVLE